MSACEPEIGPLVSLHRLSKLMGVSEKELRRLRDEEGLPAYRIGKRWWRAIPAEVRRWLDERSTWKVRTARNDP